jgi:uncharacterized protein YfdQ (DUF2303 family)
MTLPPETVEHLQRTAVAAAAPTPVPLGGSDLVQRVLPQGYQVHTTDLGQYAPNPRRRIGKPVFSQAASFGAYVAAQKVAGTTLYADAHVDASHIIAVIDGHEPAADDGAAGWGEHRAVLTLRKTASWLRWMGASGTAMAAEDFADFLELNAADVVAPDTATLVELARTLEVHKDVTYTNITRPVTGARRLHYEETVTARAGETGTIDIPDTLELGITPWEGSDRFKVEAKFRFRLRAGKLTFAYELIRPDSVLELAFGDVLGAVAETTGLVPLHGRP